MATIRTYEPAELAQRIVDELSDKQVEDLALIDISKVSGFADYMIVGTADNPRQLRAATDALDVDLGMGERLRAREGTADSGWLLLDYGDVVVHLFNAESRRFYRLEDLWGRNAPVTRFT